MSAQNDSAVKSYVESTLDWFIDAPDYALQLQQLLDNFSISKLMLKRKLTSVGSRLHFNHRVVQLKADVQAARHQQNVSELTVQELENNMMLLKQDTPNDYSFAELDFSIQQLRQVPFVDSDINSIVTVVEAQTADNSPTRSTKQIVVDGHASLQSPVTPMLDISSPLLLDYRQMPTDSVPTSPIDKPVIDADHQLQRELDAISLWATKWSEWLSQLTVVPSTDTLAVLIDQHR